MRTSVVCKQEVVEKWCAGTLIALTRSVALLPLIHNVLQPLITRVDRTGAD